MRKKHKSSWTSHNFLCVDNVINPKKFELSSDHNNILKWNKPNDTFKIRYSNSITLTTPFRFDDTPHHPDLILYRHIPPMPRIMNYSLSNTRKIKSIMEECRETISLYDPWYVKQQIKKPERIGIKKFAQLPLKYFLLLWRKPIDPKKMYIIAHAGITKGCTVSIDGLNSFKTTLIWDEINHGYEFHHVKNNEEKWKKTIRWFGTHCKHKIYLYTDAKSMFTDEEDEFFYITDCVL